jgi:hypothetical protein
MPKIGISKEQLEGLKNPAPGIYDFRLDGFNPKYAKEKEGKERSINMRPKLVIINHPTLNGESIMTHGNTAFGVELYDMCHALGVPYENEGSDNPTIPGDFNGPDDDPSKWQYVGPLVGQTGKIELADKQGSDNKVRSQVKRYFCRVPGCQASHRESLL